MIMKKRASRLLSKFVHKEQSSGIVLMLSTLLAMLCVNSASSETFLAFWQMDLGANFDVFHYHIHLKHTLLEWVNDLLMAIFFLLIGLEIEREVFIGELSTIKSATLPVCAAIGGMVAPALIHYGFNHGTITQSGFGIPMATDIAFSLGVLALLGSCVPLSLKIFLAAFAIFDDLGAILVIAIFYVGNFSLSYLMLAMGVFGILLILNRLKVERLWVYLVLGLVMWYFMLMSGIHATLAGVLLAFAIPFSGGDEDSMSYQLQKKLHIPVAFIIMPIFALANAGVLFSTGWVDSLTSPNSLGITLGLLVGKPLGIVLMSVFAVKMGLARLPAGVSLGQLVGVGFLGGIGFTMSIFITQLAFTDPMVIQQAKIAVLLASVLAGVIGYVLIKAFSPSGKSKAVTHAKTEAESA